VIFTTVWQVATDKTGGFVISRVILAALNSVFTSVFLLFLDVPYWLPLGLFTGLVSQFVPTVGTYIGGVIPAIVAVVNDPKDGLFVVIFVATRNIFTAFWLSVGLVIVIGYLLNEHSSLYLFGEPVPLPASITSPSTPGLTPEEQEIYKRLHEKIGRNESAEALKRDKAEPIKANLTQWYKDNMRAIQRVIN
jgi:hypothetical protein